MNLFLKSHEIGILDADVYGPSIPRMMALRGQPELNKRMVGIITSSHLYLFDFVLSI